MAATVGRGRGHSPANVTKHLKGIDFPANKKDLVKHAQQLKADKEVIDEIQQMEDREYGSMADVMKAFGKEQPQQRQATQSKQTKQSQAHK